MPPCALYCTLSEIIIDHLSTTDSQFVILRTFSLICLTIGCTLQLGLPADAGYCRFLKYCYETT